jgi:hypothetical protein
MTALIVLPIVLVAASVLALLLDDSVEMLLPPTLFATTLLVYAFGLFDALLLGVWCAVLLVVGLAAFAVIRQGGAGFGRALVGLASPGITIYAVFAVLLFFVTRDMPLAHYDEFSHWGRIVRAMFLYDSLGPYNPVELSFRSYPPASATFEYLVAKLGGAWAEGNLFWAYQLLYGSVFIPFMAGIRWKDLASIAVSTFLLFATPHLVLDPLRATLVDPLLGVVFGYLLALIYVSDARRWNLTLYVSLGCAVLVLTKDAGGLFAGIALVAYLWRLIQAERAAGPSANFRLAAIRFATALGALWAARRSWDLLLSNAAIEKRFQAAIDPRELLGFFTGDVRSYWPEVLENYSSAFVSAPIFRTYDLPVSQLALFVVFGIVLAAAAWVLGRTRAERPSWGIPLIAYGGAAAYTAILLIFYLYRFREDQAVGLASYERYLGTYWVGLASFVTFVLLWCLVAVRTDPDETSLEARRAVYLGLAGWCVILLVLVPVKDAVMSYAAVPRFNREVRSPYSTMAERIRQTDMETGSRALVLTDNAGGGYEGQVLQYLLVSSDVDFQSADEGAEETSTVSGSARSEVLGYDYLVVFSGARTSLQRFDPLLAEGGVVEPETVYRIEREGADVILVVPDG